MNNEVRRPPPTVKRCTRESELPTSIMLDGVLMLKGYAEAGLLVLLSANQSLTPLIMVRDSKFA